MADTDGNGAGSPPNQPSATGDNVRSATIPEDPGAQRDPPSGTFFGLSKNQLHSWGGVGAAPRDYKTRYPPDPYGQEMSAMARIWSIYLDEAAHFDANMLAEWRDTIDVLLVFAGLFSAVLTTFVVQTSQSMQPDYNQASAILLLEILKATASNGSQISIPSSPTDFFSLSRSDEWVNSLWFVSLTLSLITALVAVLVKQWLHQYVSIVSDSSPRDRARIRHLRYAGLQTWQVPMIIGMLPVLLHGSLALFFAGLAIFLFSLGMKVAWLVSIIGTVTYVAYVIALILPLVHPYCLYKVPLTVYIHHLYRFFYDRLITPILIIRQYPYNYSVYSQWYLHNDFSHICDEIFPLQCLTLKEIEHAHVQKYATKVDAQSLQWLHSSTSNASVHQSVLQAIAGMSSTTLKCLPDEYISTLMVPLEQQIQHIALLVSSPDVERELELYYRASILLQPSHFLYGRLPDYDYMTDRCRNEQLKTTLFSMTSSEKALAAFLRILQGPQRSSLTLHSVVWKWLVYRAIPDSGNGTLELELELMKIIVRPSSKGESGEVTTINKPTDEMREFILYLLSEYRPLPIAMSTATGSFPLDLHIILALIFRMEQRLCDSTYASNRKQLIETSLTIIEFTANILVHNLTKGSEVKPVLGMLYSLLSSKAFANVSPDLQPLAHKIFIILDKYHPRMKPRSPDIRFYSVAYQCYLHPPAGGGERSENNVMPHILRCLISSWNPSSMHDSKSHEPFLTPRSHYLLPASSMTDFDSLDSDSQETPLDPLLYPSHFLVNRIFWVMLLLIKEHNESVLYEWTQHPAMQNVWPECLLRLVRWASGEEFRQWNSLERVLAIGVIGELQNILGHSNNNETLPQYDYGIYKDVDQLPWLHEVASSSSDGEPNALKYSQIAKHPKFQESLHSHLQSQEDAVNE